MDACHSGEKLLKTTIALLNGMGVVDCGIIAWLLLFFMEFMFGCCCGVEFCLFSLPYYIYIRLNSLLMLLFF